MSLLDVINRLMGTTPPPMCPNRQVPERVAQVRADVDQLKRDLDTIEASVALAEARLRARGWRPDSQDTAS